MIRFAWVQARTQTAVVVAALAAAAILAAITGPRLLHFYDVNVATCQVNNDCAGATTAFLASYRWMQVFLPPALLVLNLQQAAGKLLHAPLGVFSGPDIAQDS